MDVRPTSIVLSPLKEKKCVIWEINQDYRHQRFDSHLPEKRFSIMKAVNGSSSAAFAIAH